MISLEYEASSALILDSYEKPHDFTRIPQRSSSIQPPLPRRDPPPPHLHRPPKDTEPRPSKPVPLQPTPQRTRHLPLHQPRHLRPGLDDQLHIPLRVVLLRPRPHAQVAAAAGSARDVAAGFVEGFGAEELGVGGGDRRGGGVEEEVEGG